MNRQFTIALIATLCFNFTASADDKTKPSPAIKKILDKAVVDVKKNRDDFAKANQTPLSDARTALEDLAKKLVDEKQYDQVKAVTDQIATLETDVLKMADAAASVTGKPAPPRPLLERLAGKWSHPNYDYTFVMTPTGDVSETSKSKKKIYTGKMRVLNDDTAEVQMSSGYRFEISPAGDNRLAILIWDATGKLAEQGRCLVRER